MLVVWCSRSTRKRACKPWNGASRIGRPLGAGGEYAHISVRAERGHLNIRVGDGDPVAHFAPLGVDHYGLGFHSHTGRWEPMRFVGDLAPLVHDLVTVLGPCLARPDFSDRESGPDH